MKKIIILFLIIFLLTGCLGYNELDNLMIINDIYIDKGSMILNEVVADRSDTINKEYKKYKISCKSIDKCFDRFKSFPRKIYLSHLNNIIINTDIDKNDLEQLIKNLNTHKELREDFYIVYSSNNKINNSILEKYLRHDSKSITYYDLEKSILNKSILSIPVVTYKNNNINTNKYIKIDWRDYEKS